MLPGTKNYAISSNLLQRTSGTGRPLDLNSIFDTVLQKNIFQIAGIVSAHHGVQQSHAQPPFRDSTLQNKFEFIRFAAPSLRTL